MGKYMDISTNNNLNENNEESNEESNEENNGEIIMDIKTIPNYKKLKILHNDLFVSSELSEKILYERIKAAYKVIFDRMKSATKKNDEDLKVNKKELSEIKKNIKKIETNNGKLNNNLGKELEKLKFQETALEEKISDLEKFNYKITKNDIDQQIEIKINDYYDGLKEKAR